MMDIAYAVLDLLCLGKSHLTYQSHISNLFSSKFTQMRLW